jgi:hypothetical protein
MGGPTSSYAAADIALEFIGAHKPPHPATECFQQGGDTIEGVIIMIYRILKNNFTPFIYLYKSNYRQESYLRR